jgi:uncharacterized coiled-coil protein SlyX
VNADDPLEASKVASDAFGAAFKKVKSALKAVSVQRIRRLPERAAPKRFGGRVVPIAVPLVLGLVCIILGAGLVAAFVVYSPRTGELESQLAEKDNTISALQLQVQSLQNNVNQSNSQLAVLNQRVVELTTQISNLQQYYNQVLFLNMSNSLLYQQGVNLEPGANFTVWNDVLQYAGYLTVQVQSSSNTTWIEVIYSAYGVTYDSKVTVGTGASAAFPVLPSQVAIIIGNTETVDAVSAAVTATYTY